MSTEFDQAKAIGDAVLYEGYLLYPYRASAAKNQLRWQFGVLMPPAVASPHAGEHSDAFFECLLEPGPHAVCHLKLRFLQAQHRSAEERTRDGYRPVEVLNVDGAEYTTWDEAVEREVDVVLPVPELIAQRNTVPYVVGGEERAERLGRAGRLVRRTWPVSGELRLKAEPLAGPYGGLRLRVEVVNTTQWFEQDCPRQIVLRHALLAAHVVLAVNSGRFMSLTDPPEWARPATEECRNERMWPVLIGENDNAMLASPIILYDHPAIAAESAGELFDGTEIDEILTLRTMALTDAEKREARATDERAKAVVDRVDAMPPELLERLHGTIRYLRSVTGPASPPEEDGIFGNRGVPWWDPAAEESVSPETDTVVVSGVALAAGSRVRLRPGHRRTDAQDMFLTGRIATVRAVLSDVDGNRHLAVTVDEDPAAQLQHAHGRYRYFAPDEVEPLPAGEAR
ncbi:MAG TPA: hypothetical protein VFG87_16155 [Amycolatopsis sp.]|nr:hypothetical protein [Amycolatopsis sp.]